LSDSCVVELRAALLLVCTRDRIVSCPGKSTCNHNIFSENSTTADTCQHASVVMTAFRLCVGSVRVGLQEIFHPVPKVWVDEANRVANAHLYHAVGELSLPAHEGDSAK
jgi:hypothetical protein